MAYAAFADAPVDVAVVEVGMGGTWDATNVVDADGRRRAAGRRRPRAYLGDTPADIALEKAGIIKPGSIAVLAEQRPRSPSCCSRRAAEVGATVVREGMEFGVDLRAPAVGGQVVSLQGLRGRYDEVFLPLYGAHQAQNAAVALAAVEAFPGDQPLDEELVRAAFAEVTSPGRLEIVRRSPTIVLDAAHNPHGAEATGAALEDSFTFDPLIGVIGVMADKDHEGLLAALRAAPRPRGLHPELHLPRDAGRPTGRDRPRDLRRGPGHGRPAARRRDRPGGRARRGRRGVRRPARLRAVLVTGSVVTVGEARCWSASEAPDERAAASTPRHERSRSPRAAACAPRCSASRRSRSGSRRR